MSNKLLIITGPTASGKSGFSVEIAKTLDGEIISADSMQVYKHMDIGTAKITELEKQGIPHHMIDILEPDSSFSVAEYVAEAQKLIAEIQSRGKLPIMVGGTTMYIQSVIDNIQFFDIPKDEEIRENLKKTSREQGNEVLWTMLEELDPKLAKTLHINNHGRIIRGIEVAKLTGKPLSQWQEESREVPSPHKQCLIGLAYKDRKILYDKINVRVDQMLADGLLPETEMLKNIGASKTARQAIGYKELFPHIENQADLEECINRLKMETRRYAKRQMTWMRSRPELNWIYKDDLTREDQFEAGISIINQIFKG